MKCPHCNQETETAEYLDGENGHESAQMCVNEDCKHYGEYYCWRDDKMTLAQAKKKCKAIHKGVRHTRNYYLIKYSDGWTIGTPEEFSTGNTKAIDMILFTL